MLPESSGVHPGRVRQLVAAGALEAERIAGRWLLNEDAVTSRNAADRPQGRPLSPRAAWGLLAAASGDPAPWLEASEYRRARSRAADWSLAHWSWACQRRAEVHRLYAHPSVLARLAGDERIVRSGASVRNLAVDVIASEFFEGYLSSGRVDAVIDDYALGGRGRVNVVLRVPPADLSVFGGERDAAWPVVAVDLFDAGDDRSRRAAAGLIARFRR